jgi:hypothetical protein
MCNPPSELDVDVVDVGAGGRREVECWLVERGGGRAAGAAAEGAATEGEVTRFANKASISSRGDAAEDAGEEC